MKKQILGLLLMFLLLMGLMTSEAKAATNYNVWIGGQQITSENLSGNGSISGSWQYIPASPTKAATLIFSSYRTEYATRDYFLVVGTDSAAEDLNIVFAGANEITTAKDAMMIKKGSSVSITGNDITSSVAFEGAIYGGYNPHATISISNIDMSVTTEQSATSAISVPTIEISDAIVAAKSLDNNGISANRVTISGGSEVEASGDAYGIYGSYTTICDSADVTATANNCAIASTVFKITTDGTVIAKCVGAGQAMDEPSELPEYYKFKVNTEATPPSGDYVVDIFTYDEAYKYVEIVGLSFAPPHTHGNWEYAADGATLTATCGKAFCTLTDKKESLTISASNTVYDMYEKAAVIGDTSGLVSALKDVAVSDIMYAKKLSGGSFGTPVSTAPADAGTYQASLTVGGKTAKVVYTIQKADAYVALHPDRNVGLVADGTELELVGPGIAKGGTLMYKLGENGTYSTEIPTVTEAGDYKVYYKVFSDSDNFNDSNETYITVSVAAGHVHDYDQKVENNDTLKDAAECTKDAVYYYSCECGDISDEETFVKESSKLNHNYVEGFCTRCEDPDPNYREDDAEYKILDGAEQVVEAGKDASFRIEGDISKFQKVQVDGKDVDPADYTVKEDTAVVTLSADYLATLKGGNHTLSVVFADGAAGTTFQTETLVESPNTMDSSLIVWFVLLLAVSFAGLVPLVRRAIKYYI